MARRLKTQQKDSHDGPCQAPDTAVSILNDSPNVHTRSSATERSSKRSSRRSPNISQPFYLLEEQPYSLAGLSQFERDLVIVSAVANNIGGEHVVSRIGDQVWDLTSLARAKNKPPSYLKISWPTDVPKALIDDAKAALYCYMRNGRNGRKPTASTVCTIAKYGITALYYLTSLGLRDFGSVRTLYLTDYIGTLLNPKKVDPLSKEKGKRKLQPLSAFHRLTIVDLVWHFPMEVFHPLQEHPWGSSTLFHACGCSSSSSSSSSNIAGKTGKTLVIPREAQRILFEYCSARLEDADKILAARDQKKITDYSPDLRKIRDAVLYLAEINSGMRNSECIGITSNCWRTEVKNGVTFHWVRTREVKTTGGMEFDFLVPPELLDALVILQRYAEPLQNRLAEEADWLEKNLDAGIDDSGNLANGMTLAEAVGRLNHIHEIGQHLFLGLNSSRSDHIETGSRVDVMSVTTCNTQLKALASAAGLDWNLTNHQCRRTFAYNVANSKLGRMGLVFLKWQLKHSSLSWTQLYASNPRQDHSLYTQLQEEQIAVRAELLEGWVQSDEPLSGGAGKKLMEARATPAKNLKELLQLTAESIDILFTGHGICMSGAQGCGGEGVYDPSQCGACSQSVIDRDQSSTWQMIHLENLRLASLVDCGPAVAQKVRRSIQKSEQVLRDLGITPPILEVGDLSGNY